MYVFPFFVMDSHHLSFFLRQQIHPSSLFLFIFSARKNVYEILHYCNENKSHILTVSCFEIHVSLLIYVHTYTYNKQTQFNHNIVYNKI